eukprot:TRINITY_DN6753_c0_g1_i1.p1 TRINITY_DN6753_c0_g1~~TRINITY_DN6753_c0_g1_i1.p1  ORF type:complete len:329 (+),score=94.53 TRINITY_DN6753_c0_g1_i1:119-1105(+)
MKFAVILVLAILGLAFAAIEHCDPSYDCTFASGDGEHFFDFSHLCAPEDYVFDDDGRDHQYYANICGHAKKSCTPGWIPGYEHGVAVQTWGGKPADCAVEGETCFHSDGSASCCTESCEVVGLGLPDWGFVDPENPVTGGVYAYHTAAPAAADDRYKCHNPQREVVPRAVKYIFHCNPHVDTVIPMASFQAENRCNYTLVFETKAACSLTPKEDSISTGWKLILITFGVVLTAYLTTVVYQYSVNKEFNPAPGKEKFFAFVGLVQDGVQFTLNGFSKTGSMKTTTVPYSSITASAFSGEAAPAEESKKTETTKEEETPAKNTEAYSDL